MMNKQYEPNIAETIRKFAPGNLLARRSCSEPRLQVVGCADVITRPERAHGCRRRQKVTFRFHVTALQHRMRQMPFICAPRHSVRSMRWNTTWQPKARPGQQRTVVEEQVEVCRLWRLQQINTACPRKVMHPSAVCGWPGAGHRPDNGRVQRACLVCSKLPAHRRWSFRTEVALQATQRFSGRTSMQYRCHGFTAVLSLEAGRTKHGRRIL